MKAVDDDGREIDAIFSAEPTADGAVIVLESRGGSESGPTPARNPGYARGLELLLRRLGRERATLTDVEIFSRETQHLSPERRRISTPGFPLPLELGPVTDLEPLRLELGRASAAFGRNPAKTSGGNPTKRLRLTVRWPGAMGRTAQEIEDVLAGVRRPVEDTTTGSAYAPLGELLRSSSDAMVRLSLGDISALIGRTLPLEAWKPQFWSNAVNHHRSRRGQWLDAGYDARFERRTETVVFTRRVAPPELELSTADAEELQSRTNRARAKIRAGGGRTPPPPPGNAEPRQTSATGSRFVRDPNVVAWVLENAGGVCEACDEPAPFEDADGRPFLEVHHVRPLAEGGPDVVENAAACCPNCHRRLHLGGDKAAFRAATIAKVSRLRDYPARAVMDLRVPAPAVPAADRI